MKRGGSRKITRQQEGACSEVKPKATQRFEKKKFASDILAK